MAIVLLLCAAALAVFLAMQDEDRRPALSQDLPLEIGVHESVPFQVKVDGEFEIKTFVGVLYDPPGTKMRKSNDSIFCPEDFLSPCYLRDGVFPISWDLMADAKIVAQGSSTDFSNDNVIGLFRLEKDRVYKLRFHTTRDGHFLAAYTPRLYLDWSKGRQDQQVAIFMIGLLVICCCLGLSGIILALLALTWIFRKMSRARFPA